MPVRFLKLMSLAAVLCLGGCQSAAAAAETADAAQLSCSYAEVTAVTGSSITVLSGTVQQPEDPQSSKTQTQQKSSDSKQEAAPQASAGAATAVKFTAGTESLIIPLDDSITVLKGEATVSMNEIEAGNVLMLTYMGDTLRAIEILVQPDAETGN